MLKRKGLDVRGSDQDVYPPMSDFLAAEGIPVMSGYSAEHITGDLELVIVGNAISRGNPELEEVLDRKIRYCSLPEAIREHFLWGARSIVIAGTHGKTTTTSLTGMVLTEAGFDPTIVVGGQVRILGTNARLGKGDFLVAEADEFDRSFLKLTPVVAVVTNIEEDHLDCYKDLEDILDSFSIFANRVPFYGSVIACADDPGVRQVLPRITRRVVTYGVAEEANLRAKEIRLEAAGTTFEVWEGTWLLGTVRLSLPGRHNVSNALAAIAVGRELSIPFPTIARALSQFTGVIRRFETKGERDGVLVVDDYAHHPTEISATLAAARQVYPDRRLAALFQPHLYSRTRDFAEQFGRALTACDVALVTDVYPSRERPIPGITGEVIADAARQAGHPSVTYISEKKLVVSELRRTLRPGDVLLTLGAGDVVRFGEEYLKRASG